MRDFVIWIYSENAGFARETAVLTDTKAVDIAGRAIKSKLRGLTFIYGKSHPSAPKTEAELFSSAAARWGAAFARTLRFLRAM